MEKWLNYALHGNIKIGADVTPLRMPSEADFMYLWYAWKKNAKRGPAICEPQKKNESVFYAIRIAFSGNFMCAIFTV